MYKIFAQIKRLWVGLGSPFPSVVRHVRYAWLGRQYPPRILANDAHQQNTEQWKRDVAVIIPCHNYGRYVAGAIESILSQTVKPSTILVIDDASTDDTQDVIARYKEKGVRSIHVECKSLALTRNVGAKETTSTFLLYLDADDTLPPDYIEKCLEKTTDPHVALVYGDFQNNGDNHYYFRTADFSEDLLSRANFISSHALIRRDAFDAVSGYRQITHSFEDWDFYRRVIAKGYTAAHADTFVQYRVHKDSMSQVLMQSENRTYFKTAALAQHPITIFTHWTGQMQDIETFVDLLLQIDRIPALVSIHWHNSSADPLFDAALRNAMSKLPFAECLYTAHPLPPETHVEVAALDALNDMILRCNTEYVWSVGESTRIHPDTLTTLQTCMEADVVAVYAADASEAIATRNFACALFRKGPLKALAPFSFSPDLSPEKTCAETLYTLLDVQGDCLSCPNAKTTSIQNETVSPAPIQADLCVSLSGREWMWPLTQKFLEEQQYPHTLIHLILLDTSQNTAFGHMVREWLQTCDYGKTTYLQETVGERGLADKPRDTSLTDVCRACVQIYARFQKLTHSSVVFFLEDDVLPPVDTYRNLYKHLTPGVGSVSAVYWHRHEKQPVCWNWNGDAPVFPIPGKGISDIGGNGFGCVAVRGPLFRKTVLRFGPDWQNYDYYFYKDLRAAHGKALLDWDAVCRHYADANTWS